MTDIFVKVLNMSITASYAAIIVLLVRMLLKKAPKIFSYMLWSVVLFRLICPINFSSSLSLLKPLNKSSNYVPHNIGLMEKPTINTNIETIDRVINDSLPGATPYASVNPMQILMSLFTLIWILGITVLIIYSIYSYIKIYRKTQFSTLVTENIYETDQISTPFVFGLIRPKIYLPIGLLDNELDYIISHEKTHIRRFDYLIKPISFLVLTLHWFNPVIWICYYLMIKDMEMSCDESVLKKSGEDLKGNYSSSLLNLSIRQSGLLSPLAFGESNIKSRIKNILNYKKPSFWTIFIALIVVIAISIGLITNPINSAKNIAEEFLTTYYTIENTDIADMVYDESLWDKSGLDENGLGMINVIGIDEAVKSKYGDFMTEDALNRASANRTILIGEMTAKEYGSKMSVDYINLWDEKISDNGDITYQYNVPVVVKFKDGFEEPMNLNGTLVMKEIDGKWNVSDFQINVTELSKVLQFGKSFLSIINHSDASIRRVEVDTKENSMGAMNANETNMEKNTGFTFEMIDEDVLEFTVKLLDKDGEILYEQSFIGDSSEGKDVYLYIQEDKDGNLEVK